MGKVLYINKTVCEYRAALVEDDQVVEFFIDRNVEREGMLSARLGNIYKGKVAKIRPGIGAAFVDIGCEKKAFLYLNRPAPSPYMMGEREGSQIIPDDLSSHDDPLLVRTFDDSPLRVGDSVLVQVSREPVGIKGAKLTRNIKLASRHLVYAPFVDSVGISNRITDEEERSRLMGILEEVRLPGEGVVARTFAEGVPTSVLQREMGELVEMWKKVGENYSKKRKVGVCYEEVSFIQRMLREIIDDGLDEIWVDTPECLEEVRRLPSLKEKCKLYEGEYGPLFKRFGIEKEWNFALTNKVYLRSGGVLNVDQTEAMVSIDVNTGRFIGKANLEETVLKANLEAVKEIARQLRLRNCGGIIVIDFIDMSKEEHREEVFQSLMETLSKDRAKYSVMPISGLGLVEMTRKQVRDTLVRAVCAPCSYCGGSGWVKSVTSVCYELLRDLKVQLRDREKSGKVWICAHPTVIEKLQDKDEFGIVDVMQYEGGRPFEICSDKAYHTDEYSIVLRN